MVCGMDVSPRASGFMTEYRGQAYFFCSQSCLDEFNKDPERYLGEGVGGGHDHGGHSMHMDMGCCGGMGHGWMRYLWIGMMLLYLASRLLR